MPEDYLKFIYFEKAAKFCEISTVDLSYVVTVKSTMEISQTLWPSQNIWTLFILTRILVIAKVDWSLWDTRTAVHFYFISKTHITMQGKRDSTIYSQIISIPTGRFFMLLKKNFAFIVISKKMCKIIIQIDFGFLINLLYKVDILRRLQKFEKLSQFLFDITWFKKSWDSFSNCCGLLRIYEFWMYAIYMV